MYPGILNQNAKRYLAMKISYCLVRRYIQVSLADSFFPKLSTLVALTILTKYRQTEEQLDDVVCQSC